MQLLIWVFLFLSYSSNFQMVATVQSRCNHLAELSALLQFKNSFRINCVKDYDNPDLGYSKLSSWEISESFLNGTANWDGVQCDPISGHVIGLDLSGSCINGSINGNISNIFGVLIHLEHLNLAFNHFQGSSIPSALANLSRLTYLNLSSSAFGGQVPLWISKLSKLTSLDLSINWDLELNLENTVQWNLSSMEELDLSWMRSVRLEVPKFLFTNMSSLRSLKLCDCGLYGEFPQGIFHLPNLQHLRISYNEELRGQLPTDFNSSTTPLLESLILTGTNFSGTLPDSIGNLLLLRELDLSFCKISGPIPISIGNLLLLRTLGLYAVNFSGPIPASIGNLVMLIGLELSHCNFSGVIPASLGKLASLRVLHLSGANLIGEIPSSIANLSNLYSLDLSGNRLTGHIPSDLANLTQLSVLRLANNRLTGEIPLGIGNLTKLFHLDLSNNTLHGSLPIWNLKSLEVLDVGENELSDTLELEMFLEFSNLTDLILSSNNLTLLQHRKVSIDSTLPRFSKLGLSSCRLSKFPKFVLHQQKMMYLGLSHNSIEGSIPKWMESIETLNNMDLSHNLITSFDDPYLFFRRTNLINLDISFNKIRGSVPLPSPSVITYRVSNNELTGEIPHSFCNLSLLQVLDLSNNHLSGELDPHCFSNSSLVVLNLRNNSFHGRISEFCTRGTDSPMRMIHLNTNQFQEKIPRSLANCLKLEFFDAGSNFINDEFPSWLGSLPQLKVFILKDNALHGSIGMLPNSSHWFPELIIIDLSRNRLSGNLSSWRFERWLAMKTTKSSPNYMGQIMHGYPLTGFYEYSIIMHSKGIEIEYSKFLDALIVIDLSSNGFEGEIPTIMGDLRGLRLLNLSNNHLYGSIPSSLRNLIEMESLDLSANSLTGLIPPQGQLSTFSNASYLDNPGLCGEPLSKKCSIFGQQDALPPDEMKKKDDKFWEDLWMVVLIGFGGGLVIGVAVENMVDWRRRN